MQPIDYRHYRFLRREPPQLKFIPFEDEPPPLENQFRVPAILCAIAMAGFSLLLLLVW